MLVFEEIREPEGEKPLGAINEDNQQQTKSTYGVNGRWRPIRAIVLLHIELTNFTASGANSLGPKGVNRATKNRTKDFFESLYQNELGVFSKYSTLEGELAISEFLGKWFLFAWELKTHLLSLAFKQRLGQLGNGPLDKIAPPSSYQRAILEDVL